MLVFLISSSFALVLYSFYHTPLSKTWLAMLQRVQEESASYRIELGL